MYKRAPHYNANRNERFKDTLAQQSKSWLRDFDAKSWTYADENLSVSALRMVEMLTFLLQTDSPHVKAETLEKKLRVAFL